MNYSKIERKKARKEDVKTEIQNDRMEQIDRKTERRKER